MAELETVGATDSFRATLEDWEPGENVDVDALLKEGFLLTLDILDSLRAAVYEEWGHNWQTQPACRRVLGERLYDVLQERERSAIETMTAYHQLQEQVMCRHCGRVIVKTDEGVWVDPEATGDDSIWRETCDRHDTFVADHEPEGA
jgi:ribosomal protein S8